MDNSFSERVKKMIISDQQCLNQNAMRLYFVRLYTLFGENHDYICFHKSLLDSNSFDQYHIRQFDNFILNCHNDAMFYAQC